MSSQNKKPESNKELENSEPSETSQQDGQDQDELSDEALKEISGGLIWQPSPTSGNGQYTNPVPWTPKP